MTHHQPWCTDHLAEDPADPFTEGADDCSAVLHVLDPRDGWGGVAVTISQELDTAEPVLTVESYSRLLTVDEAARLYAVLGEALEAVRRS